tara:strand:- start:1256 stop:1564 length:309 start_codon:yes stop_codon:yes gene_type:complete
MSGKPFLDGPISINPVTDTNNEFADRFLDELIVLTSPCKEDLHQISGRRKMPPSLLLAFHAFHQGRIARLEPQQEERGMHVQRPRLHQEKRFMLLASLGTRY